MMTNEIIRQELKEKKVFQWELAHELGISEQTISRKMRFEIEGDELWRIIDAINNIARKKNKE